MLRTFRISYTDGQGRRAEARVLAFDASSAVRALKYARPDAERAECEEEPGENRAGFAVQ